MNAMKRQGGFTLVELAIVLVIIGLLLGGVLKGQELMEQARIKRLINDFNNITAAVETYKDRYGFLPGDDTAVVARWSGAIPTIPAPPAASGGNGAIDGFAFSYTTVNTDAESSYAWRHLRASGLVTGDPDANAGQQTPWSTYYGIGSGSFLGWGAGTHVFCASNLTGKAAEALDRALDDGVADRGNVKANVSTSATAVPTNTPASGQYVDNGATFYTVCKRL